MGFTMSYGEKLLARAMCPVALSAGWPMPLMLFEVLGVPLAVPGMKQALRERMCCWCVSHVRNLPCKLRRLTVEKTRLLTANTTATALALHANA